MAYQSPLGRMIPSRPDVEAIKREAWRNDRILVVQADDESLDCIEREIVQRIGNRMHGKKEDHE